AAGDVNEPGLLETSQFPDCARGRGGGDWRTEFVREKIQGAAFLPGSADFFVEAAVAGRGNAAVQRGADDGVFGIGEHDLFGCRLGFSVNAERVDGRGFVVIALTTIEYKVGGEKEKGDIRGQLSKKSGDFDVQHPGERWIGLAGGRFAQCGAMHDEPRLFPLEKLADG